MAAREAEDSGYVRGALPWAIIFFEILDCQLTKRQHTDPSNDNTHRVMEKRRQQAFSAWAGTQNIQLP